MRRFLAFTLALALALPLPAFGADQTDLVRKIEELSRELERVKQQLNEIQKQDQAKEQRIAKVEKTADKLSDKLGTPPWLEVSGDYRFRLDYLKGTVADHYRFEDVLGSMFGGPMPQLQASHTVKNDSLMTNRLGLNFKIRATEDIQLKARLLMYKTWGHQTTGPVSGDNAYFADKFNVFDGNVSHIPEDSILRVDQAYATWSNIGGLPVWFSVGRRPSTGGVPTNIRQNTEREGASGTPGLLVDYAFDGLTLGVAPDIEALPGASAKLCYGKGFDSGLRPNSGLKDVNMLGLNIVPYDTDNLHVELQWNRAFSIFAFPEETTNNIFGANQNLGDIDQFGGVVTGRIDKFGPGNLNLFASASLSKTYPNSNLVSVDTPMGPMGVAGLMYDATAFGGSKKGRTGTAVYLGARYDITQTGTKIGAEYNHGTKYWITFTPASDDIWTSKLGTRGDVYEVYAIQELKQKAIAKYGKAYFRLGYQYYKFDYTGSNNWVGEPKSISDLDNPMNAQLFTPLKKAHDVYLTFNVEF